MYYYILSFSLGAPGVATGWHGWTMSRGPGAKGAPERERETNKKRKGRKKEKKKEKKKERKKKEEKKSENETF